MEILLLILILFIALSVLLKLSVMPLKGRLAVSALFVIFAACSSGMASEMSKTELQGMLTDPAFMLDMAVLLTVDVALQISFCVTCLSTPVGLPGRILHSILLYFPGFLAFPVLFFTLARAMYALPGADFATVGYGLAALTGVSLPLLATGVRFLIPRPTERLELIFYLNCLCAMIGIVTTVNGRTAVAGTNEIDLPALGAAAILLTVGFCTGLIIFKRRRKI